jgi:hypothetical protein
MGYSTHGQPVATIGTVSVYVKEQRTSTGERRIMVQIRQAAPRRWRVSEVLCYANAAAVDMKLELAGNVDDSSEA